MTDIHEDAMEILYPTETVETSFYHNLDADTLSAVNELWEQLKIESSVGNGVYIIAGAIIILCAGYFAFLGFRKKKRSKYY